MYGEKLVSYVQCHLLLLKEDSLEYQDAGTFSAFRLEETALAYLSIRDFQGDAKYTSDRVLVHQLAQPPGVGWMAQPGRRVLLKPAYPFTSEAQFLSQLLQQAWGIFSQSIPTKVRSWARVLSASAAPLLLRSSSS